MYTNRKLIANQSVAEREKFYCEKAYEYTLRADSAEKILKRYIALLGEIKKYEQNTSFFRKSPHCPLPFLDRLSIQLRPSRKQAVCVSFFILINGRYIC